MSYGKFIESFGTEPSWHFEREAFNQYHAKITNTILFLDSMNDLVRLWVPSFADLFSPYNGELCYMRASNGTDILV